MLLRALLGNYLRVDPAALAFGTRANGKPFLLAPEPDALSFNLSRSADRCLIAVARGREVGVDLQAWEIKDDLDRLARTVFAARELAQYAALEGELRRAAFYRGWARKEAVLKLTGEGLSREPASFTVGLESRPDGALELPAAVVAGASLVDLPAPPGFSAALAAEGQGFTVRVLATPSPDDEPEEPRERCPCCGYPTLGERGGFLICPLCDWEDDGQDDADAEEVRGGPNGRYSLAQARRSFAERLTMYAAEDPRAAQSEERRALKRRLIELWANAPLAREEREHAAALERRLLTLARDTPELR